MVFRGRFLAVVAVAVVPSAVVTAVAPSAAMAQSSGFYVGAGAGPNWTAESDITGSGIDTSADLDTGWMGALSGGYAHGNGLRTELELGYRSNGVDSVGSASATGDATSWSLMSNLLYDIKNSSKFTPYIGLGLGGAIVNIDGTSPVNSSRIDESDTVFAYQGIAGLSYNLNDAAHLFADYRYMRTLDVGVSTDAGSSVDVDYANHSILLGVRYAFGAPAKPAPKAAPAAVPAAMAAPAPAPVAPRNYLVFFDFAKSNLTPEAEAILATAAANLPRTGMVRLDVTGHADRSGTDKFNMALSLNRANAVKQDLVRRGIPANEIVISAKGESDPLVPTADGIREPQNRRVEIVIK